jgi:hypothetical protein
MIYRNPHKEHNMFLIIYTDSETSDIGRISEPFTSPPSLNDIVVWNGKPLENDGNCDVCTWTVIDCTSGKEEGSINIGMGGDMWKLGYLKWFRANRPN